MIHNNDNINIEPIKESEIHDNVDKDINVGYELIKELLLLSIVCPIVLLVDLLCILITVTSDFRKKTCISDDNPSLLEKYLNNFDEDEINTVFVKQVDWIKFIKRLLYIIVVGPMVILGNIVCIMLFPIMIFF